MSRKVKVILKKDTFSFVFEENGVKSKFFVFDYENRLNIVFEGGKTYRIGFDHSILSSDVEGFRFLSSRESEFFIRRIYEEVRETLNKGGFEVIDLGCDVGEESKVLGKLISVDCEELFEKSKKFREVIGHVPVLPPDQYMSLYVPLTVGCSYNKCSFCNLYKSKTFRIREIEEIEELIIRILELFGKSLLTRRGIFLGEGNVFVERNEHIMMGMRVIKNVLKESPYIRFDINSSFYGFMDTFHTTKGIDELKALRREGVRRVYIGLETGDEFILSNLLNKPSEPEKILKVVNDLKSVGVNVGIIILVGVGGKEFRDRHFSNTVGLVKKMKLGAGDIIYLSPIVEYPQLEYSRILNEKSIQRMSNEEIQDEVMRFKKWFSDFEGVKVVVYRVDRFLYA